MEITKKDRQRFDALDELTQEYIRWGAENGIQLYEEEEHANNWRLVLCSADELCTEGFSEDQKKYLNEFIDRWQKVESLFSRHKETG
tara:strand:+ start:1647 stop:1907 length:261 start_codon:yes stop_codon:yes gene_type:complete